MPSNQLLNKSSKAIKPNQKKRKAYPAISAMLCPLIYNTMAMIAKTTINDKNMNNFEKIFSEDILKFYKNGHNNFDNLSKFYKNVKLF